MLLVRLLDLWEAGASAPQNCLPGSPRPFAAPGCLCAGMASCSHESPRGGDRLWAHSRKRAAAEGGSRRLHDKQLVAVATAGARGGLRRSGMALETRVTAAGVRDVQAPHSPKHTAHSCLHCSRFSLFATRSVRVHVSLFAGVSRSVCPTVELLVHHTFPVLTHFGDPTAESYTVPICHMRNWRAWTSRK